MKKTKKMLHLPDDGFSLMELLVAMMVSAVVTAAAAGFLIAGIRFYQRADAETTVQTESQVAELFITELLQESVDYREIPFTEYPSDVLYALEVTRTDGASVLVFKDKKLWFGVVDVSHDDTTKINDVLGLGKSQAFLADYVETFSVSPGDKTTALTTGNGMVKVEMKFQKAEKSYTEAATISLRNKKRN